MYSLRNGGKHKFMGAETRIQLTLRCLQMSSRCRRDRSHRFGVGAELVPSWCRVGAGLASESGRSRVEAGTELDT